MVIGRVPASGTSRHQATFFAFSKASSIVPTM